MSRVGKKPIVIPQGVDVTIDGTLVTVKGPKAELSQRLNEKPVVTISEEDGQKVVTVSVPNPENKDDKTQWGTARALINNLVVGVTEGFSKSLEVNGVGYRVSLQGRTLVLAVGYSHDVRVELPDDVEAEVDGNIIKLKSPNKHSVGQLADNIRKIRKPEPYKGKGIKYTDEVIRRKAGKTQKSE